MAKAVAKLRSWKTTSAIVFLQTSGGTDSWTYWTRPVNQLLGDCSHELRLMHAALRAGDLEYVMELGDSFRETSLRCNPCFECLIPPLDAARRLGRPDRLPVYGQIYETLRSRTVNQSHQQITAARILAGAYHDMGDRVESARYYHQLSSSSRTIDRLVAYHRLDGIEAPRATPRVPLRIICAMPDAHEGTSTYGFLVDSLLATGHRIVVLDAGPFERFYSDAWWDHERSLFQRELYDAVERERKRGRVDLFFSYFSDRQVDAQVIRAIASLDVVTLNFNWDDAVIPYSMASLAQAYDYFWTTFPQAVPLYRQLGATPILQPAGASPRVYRPLDIEQDIDVSFVGSNYGQRRSTLSRLQEVSHNVQAYGKGFGTFLSHDEMVSMFSRSRINLGMSLSVPNRLYSEQVRHVKGRDFEVPMSGGFYLTESAPGLEELYSVGTEIVCYDGTDDLLGKAAYFLKHEDERERIREAGFRRARAEHAMERRMETVFREIGLQ